MTRPTGSTFARAARTATGKSASRTARVRAIMAACHSRGIDDDTRYDIIERVTGKRSTKDLSLPELGKVLDELNRDAGARNGTTRRRKSSTRRQPSIRPVQGKIRALWWTCYWLGAVHHGDATMDAALDAFVERQTGITALRFLTHDEAPSVIEALKDIARRHGVTWPDKAAAEWWDSEVKAERAAVLDAVGRALNDRLDATTRMTNPRAYAAKVCGHAGDPRDWAPRDWDDMIRFLGRQHRRLIADAAKIDALYAGDPDAA